PGGGLAAVADLARAALDRRRGLVHGRAAAGAHLAHALVRGLAAAAGGAVAEPRTAVGRGRAHSVRGDRALGAAADGQLAVGCGAAACAARSSASPSVIALRG